MTSSVTNLPNLAFSMTFQAWKMKFLNFITFQVFHDLYEKKNLKITSKTPSIR